MGDFGDVPAIVEVVVEALLHRRAVHVMNRDRAPLGVIPAGRVRPVGNVHLRQAPAGAVGVGPNLASRRGERRNWPMLPCMTRFKKSIRTREG